MHKTDSSWALNGQISKEITILEVRSWVPWKIFVLLMQKKVDLTRYLLSTYGVVIRVKIQIPDTVAGRHERMVRQTRNNRLFYVSS